MTITQKNRIIGQIIKNGYITRNECLRSYITRLAALIYDLKKDGWVFKETQEGNDYRYTVDKSCLPYLRSKSKIETHGN